MRGWVWHTTLAARPAGSHRHHHRDPPPPCRPPLALAGEPAPLHRRPPAPAAVLLVRGGHLHHRPGDGRAWLPATAWTSGRRGGLLVWWPCRSWPCGSSRARSPAASPGRSTSWCTCSTEIGRGNLAARAHLACGGFDEIAILARSINDMAGAHRAPDRRPARAAGRRLARAAHAAGPPARAARHRPRPGGQRRAPGTSSSASCWRWTGWWASCWPRPGWTSRRWSPRPLDAVDAARRALERAGLPADKLVSEAADGALRRRPHAGRPGAGQPAAQRRQTRRRARPAAGGHPPGLRRVRGARPRPRLPARALERLLPPLRARHPARPAPGEPRWAWAWPWWPASPGPTAARSAPVTAKAAAPSWCWSWPRPPPRPADRDRRGSGP